VVALPIEGRLGIEGLDMLAYPPEGRELLGLAPIEGEDGRCILGRAPPPPTCPMDGFPPPDLPRCCGIASGAVTHKIKPLATTAIKKPHLKFFLVDMVEDLLFTLSLLGLD